MGKKKITTLNLDEDVVRLAKKNIPNLSSFIEDCLKAYLGLDNCNFNITDIENELNVIKQANLNLFLLTDKNETEIADKQINEQELNSAWSKLWGNYRTTETYNYNDLLKLEQISGKDTAYLVDMMETLILYVSNVDLIKCETFNGAEKQYEQYLNQ